MKAQLICILVCLVLGRCFQAGVEAAEVVFEGVVQLPPAPAKRISAAARYAQKAGKTDDPEKPTAIIYLEWKVPGERAASAAPVAVKVQQKGFQFTPALVAVQAGTRVEFPNLDDDYHSVFSYTAGNKFDLGRYRKDEKPGVVLFDKPGFVRVGCEIHDHMEAIVLVLDTPHFTRTDAAGSYRLVVPGLPDGKYALKAWVGPKETREQGIEVKGEGAGGIKADFPAK